MSNLEPSDDLLEADLGLGNGLRPGAMTSEPADVPKPYDEKCCDKLDSISDNQNSGFSSTEDSEEEVMMLMPIGSIQELKSQYSHLIPRSTRSSEVFPGSRDEDYFFDGRYLFRPRAGNSEVNSSQNKCQCGNSDCESCSQKNGNSHNFPVYADVPYGTSIRQQKELFQHHLEKIKQKKSLEGSKFATPAICKKDDLEAYQGNHTSEEIAMKLAVTLQEVEDLKAELDACEQRLDSKYKAIDILRKQADEAQQRLKKKEISTKEASVKLAQVNIGPSGGGAVKVTSLGPGDLDLGDLASSKFPRYRGDREKKEVKQVSVQKYKRMCDENKTLCNTLEKRTEELRKLTARTMAIERENDELLALLDIQERSKYEHTRTTSSEENYCSFTSSELAVLGACRCRISAPDPCGCAHAAANLKKQIVHMKSELSQYKMRRDEAYHTVDAYRLAFEEQLQKNKALTLQLANISTGRNSTGSLTTKSKARVALRWLLGSLNDDELDEQGTGPNMTEYELITYLTEMLNEKREVLAHQKLASQILGDRVKTLEHKLAEYETVQLESSL